MLAEPGRSSTLGADIRALRRARGITLELLAGQLNKSVGWLSQVERDLSAPTFEDLQAISSAMSVPLSLFFGSTDTPNGERGYVVRAESRRQIGSSDGLTESLLSPDLTDDFEVVHSTFAAGAARTEPTSRDTQEVAYLAAGKLDVWIGEHAYTIQTGDSFRIKGEAYRWANPYDEPAVAIWVIAPPVY